MILKLREVPVPVFVVNAPSSRVPWMVALLDSPLFAHFDPFEKFLLIRALADGERSLRDYVFVTGYSRNFN